MKMKFLFVCWSKSGAERICCSTKSRETQWNRKKETCMKFRMHLRKERNNNTNNTVTTLRKKKIT